MSRATLAGPPRLRIAAHCSAICRRTHMVNQLDEVGLYATASSTFLRHRPHHNRTISPGGPLGGEDRRSGSRQDNWKCDLGNVHPSPAAPLAAVIGRSTTRRPWSLHPLRREFSPLSLLGIDKVQH